MHVVMSLNNIDSMYFASLTDDTINTVNMVHEFTLSSDFFDKIESLYLLFVYCTSYGVTCLYSVSFSFL